MLPCTAGNEDLRNVKQGEAGLGYLMICPSKALKVERKWVDRRAMLNFSEILWSARECVTLKMLVQNDYVQECL